MLQHSVSRFRGVAEPGFQLGEQLFDGVHVRAVGRQEVQLPVDRFNGRAGLRTLVAAQIVQHHDVARSQRRRKALANSGGECGPIDRDIEHRWRHDAISSRPSPAMKVDGFQCLNGARAISLSPRRAHGHGSASCWFSPRSRR